MSNYIHKSQISKITAQARSGGSSFMSTSKPAKSQSKAGNPPPKGKSAASTPGNSTKSGKAGTAPSEAATPKPSRPKVGVSGAPALKGTAEKSAPAKPSGVKTPPKKAGSKEAAEPVESTQLTGSPEASRKKTEADHTKILSESSKPKKKSAEPVEVPAAPPAPPRPPVKKVKLSELTDPFLVLQRDRIFQLRDSILESMQGVAKDTLRSRAEGSEASAFGMHQADAGSDAYDRDFALSLLSQEQDALYEIEEALKRMELGTYGVCEMSGKKIMQARLEALPFARYTVECQAEVERQKKLQKARMPVTSLFGLTDEEGGEGDDEDQIGDVKE
jgi:RNA polymerase-binding transcription factor DksA